MYISVYVNFFESSIEYIIKYTDNIYKRATWLDFGYSFYLRCYFFFVLLLLFILSIVILVSELRQPNSYGE